MFYQTESRGLHRRQIVLFSCNPKDIGETHLLHFSLEGYETLNFIS